MSYSVEFENCHSFWFHKELHECESVFQNRFNSTQEKLELIRKIREFSGIRTLFNLIRFWVFKWGTPNYKALEECRDIFGSVFHVQFWNTSIGINEISSSL